MGQESQERRGSGHFTELDGMRGVLACTVMLFHLGLNKLLTAATSGMLQRGEWGLSVDFFFILSGFVLSQSFSRRPPTFTSYFAKRIRRLAPMFYVSTLCMVLIKPGASLVELLANMLIVQSLVGVRSINHPGWSIPFELYLPIFGVYLVAPLQRASNYVVWLLLAMGLLLGATAAVLLVLGHDIMLLRACAGLGTGMLLYRVRSLTSDKVGGRNSRFVVFLLFAATMLLMAIAVKWPVLAVLFHPVAALCILLGANIHSVFSTAPFQALGRWSYSIYLLHVPVLNGLALLVGMQTISGSVPLKTTVITLTIVLAAFAYHFIERPFFSPKSQAAQSAP